MSAQRQRVCLQVPRLANSRSGDGIEGKQARPYTPRTNGKAERFISPLASAKQETLLEEWAYVMPYGSSTVRNDLLPAY
jgi:transposase InsO family protein